MNRTEDNFTAQNNLARIVVESVLKMPFELANVHIGPLVTNYYSFVFSLEVSGPLKMQKVFIKIPKQDLRHGPKNILPIQPGDRRLAQEEIHALQVLGSQWQSEDLKVSWVKLRGEVPQYNAIVTDAVKAQDALHIIQGWDLKRRTRLVDSRRRLLSVMTRLGTALGRFHQSNAKPIDFSIKSSIPKIEKYCREIAPRTQRAVLQKTISTIRTLSVRQFDALQVPTLKGIDLRNLLVGNSDDLFLLDPGRMKLACREADLARFIMTFRILYWGRLLFMFELRPDPKAEQAFLDAYYAETSSASSPLLSFFLIKEHLKHWHTALCSLSLMKWPLSIKQVIATVYVNPYYRKNLFQELELAI